MELKLRVSHHKVFVEGDTEAMRILANKCTINRFSGVGQGRKVIERIPLWDNFTKSFPTGLLPLIYKALSKEIQFDIIECRSYKKNTIPIRPRLREYKERELAKEAREQMEKFHVGFLASMTGTGKSDLIYDALELKAVRTLISVPTTKLRDQIALKLKKFYGTLNIKTDLESTDKMTLRKKKKSDQALKRRTGGKIDIETGEAVQDNNYEHAALTDKGYALIGGSYVKVKKGINEKEKKVRYPDVLVICNASIPTLPLEYISSVEMYIVDEGHRAKSDTIRSFLFEAENTMYRYALSATPWSDDPEGMKLLISAFGNRMVYEELPKVSMEKGYVKKTKYEQRKARAPKTWIKPSANFRVARDVGVLGNGEYNEQVIEDALFLVDHSDRTVLLAVTETVHCELLRKRFEDHGVAVYVYHGKIPSAEKESIIANAKEQGKRNIFIATIALGEGIDTTGINCVLLVDIMKNSNRLIQFGGRGSRLEDGVDELWIIDYFHYYHPKLLEWSSIRQKNAEGYYNSDEYMSDKKMKGTGIKFLRSYEKS